MFGRLCLSPVSAQSLGKHFGLGPYMSFVSGRAWGLHEKVNYFNRSV